MVDGYSELLYKLSDEAQYVALLPILMQAPTEDQLAKMFGHYLKALIDAGIIDKTEFRISEGAFGIRCIADDGHVCDSLIEREIDNYLYSNRIHHEREPSYPGSSLRADWKLQVGPTSIYVEYFGLFSRADYRVKAESKIALAEEHGIMLVAIYPFDNWIEKLNAEIRQCSSMEPGRGRS